MPGWFFSSLSNAARYTKRRSSANSELPFIKALLPSSVPSFLFYRARRSWVNPERNGFYQYAKLLEFTHDYRHNGLCYSSLTPKAPRCGESNSATRLDQKETHSHGPIRA